MKVFYLDDRNDNFGDNLNKVLLKHYGIQAEYIHRRYRGKFVGIGSVMTAVRPGDTVFGTGCIRNKPLNKPGVNFLAVRGPLTKQLVRGSKIPSVFGDPALLLPHIYDPKVEVKHKVGVIPHYIDKGLPNIDPGHQIDIQADWKTVINEVKSCQHIISSCLHGLIVADAYGIPATWAKYSDKVIGGEFKFHDYLLGTGRQRVSYGRWPKLDKEQLSKTQTNLDRAMKKWIASTQSN